VKIVVHKDALKILARMQPKRAARIRAAIQAVSDNPDAPRAGVARLRGFENALRIRVGDWRVIVRIESDTLYVTRIAARGDAYKRK